MTSSDVANPIWDTAVERWDNPTGIFQRRLQLSEPPLRARGLPATFNRLHVYGLRINASCKART